MPVDCSEPGFVILLTVMLIVCGVIEELDDDRPHTCIKEVLPVQVGLGLMPESPTAEQV